MKPLLLAVGLILLIPARADAWWECPPHCHCEPGGWWDEESSTTTTTAAVETTTTTVAATTTTVTTANIGIPMVVVADPKPEVRGVDIAVPQIPVVEKVTGLPPIRELPYTGGDTDRVLVLAGLLLAAGGLGVMVRRDPC